jgi:hypothetical protein
MARPRKTQASALDAPAGTTEERTVLTSDEAAIAHRIMADSDDWKTIKESEVDDFADQNDPLELPEPAKEMRRRRKFAFRWISRKTDRLDEVRNLPPPRKWWPCNATNTPFLNGHFDPVLGGVCKLDQILVFKPYWMFEKEQAAKMAKADRQSQSGDLKSKIGIEKGPAQFAQANEISSGDTVVFDEGALPGENETQEE